MADINLSKAVRSNLTSLQNTAALMSKTSDRLSTGNKVNSALDNPTNFFTASSLNSRAGDLNNLMDSMANGIKTIEAADNGLKAITKTVESMQSTLRQMRQDKSFQGQSFELNLPSGTTAPTAGAKFSVAGSEISLTKGTVTAQADFTVDPAASQISITKGSGTARVVQLPANATLDQTVTALNADTNLAADGVTASRDGNRLVLSTSDGSAVTVAPAAAAAAPAAKTVTGGFTTGAAQTMSVTAKTVDELVSEINSNTTLNTQVRASTDNGKLRIENLRASADLNIGKLAGGKLDFTSAGTGTGTATIANNSVREDLVTQFNDLRGKLDSLSEDASFNGINLLRGDNLKITFNESGSSSIEVQSKEGRGINSTNLGIVNQALTLGDSDESIDAALNNLGDALKSLRSQAGAFGSNLSVVQNRQDFTKSMINTLETGAGNLTLADMNQEAANMMALQTRQSLASSTLSMANQADQGVLQLLR